MSSVPFSSSLSEHFSVSFSSSSSLSKFQIMEWPSTESSARIFIYMLFQNSGTRYHIHFSNQSMPQSLLNWSITCTCSFHYTPKGLLLFQDRLPPGTFTLCPEYSYLEVWMSLLPHLRTKVIMSERSWYNILPKISMLSPYPALFSFQHLSWLMQLFFFHLYSLECKASQEPSLLFSTLSPEFRTPPRTELLLKKFLLNYRTSHKMGWEGKKADLVLQKRWE